MKEAIVLAGGLGTRLQSVVNDRPKCMAYVADKPFLDYLLDFLENENFTHLILALGYKADMVIDFIFDRENTLSISYVVEDQPLGTGGAIRLAMEQALSEDVYILNGDTFFDIDTDDLMICHKSADADVSLALKLMLNFDRYGSVDLDNQNKVIQFNEKSYQEEGFINGGIYLVKKSLFNRYSFPEKFSFEKEVLEAMVGHLAIQGCVQDAYFIDIGIPSDYEKANRDFLLF